MFHIKALALGLALKQVTGNYLETVMVRDSTKAKFVHFYAQKFLKMLFFKINFNASQEHIHEHVSFSDTFMT